MTYTKFSDLCFFLIPPTGGSRRERWQERVGGRSPPSVALPPYRSHGNCTKSTTTCSNLRLLLQAYYASSSSLASWRGSHGLVVDIGQKEQCMARAVSATGLALGEQRIYWQAGWRGWCVHEYVGMGIFRFNRIDYPYMLGLSACCERRGNQRGVAALFTLLSCFLTLSFTLSSSLFVSSAVETKLCDPDVNSQAGYFKITGSKDKNCTYKENWDKGREEMLLVRYLPSHTLKILTYLIIDCRRLLLVLRVPLKPLDRSFHYLALGRSR